MAVCCLTFIKFMLIGLAHTYIVSVLKWDKGMTDHKGTILMRRKSYSIRSAHNK